MSLSTVYSIESIAMEMQLCVIFFFYLFIYCSAMCVTVCSIHVLGPYVMCSLLLTNLDHI